MRDPKSNTPRLEPQQSIPLDKKASHQRIQNAIDRFVAGQTTDADYEVIRDRNFVYCATGIQCCQFIEAAPGRKVPFDVVFIVANTLRMRWLQAQSNQRRRALLSREPVEVPVILSELESMAPDAAVDRMRGK
jgi:hypothetical protein